MWIDAKENKPDRHPISQNASVDVILVNILDGTPYVGYFHFGNSQWMSYGSVYATNPIAFYNFPRFEGMTFEFKIIDYGIPII